MFELIELDHISVLDMFGGLQVDRGGLQSIYPGADCQRPDTV